MSYHQYCGTGNWEVYHRWPPALFLNLALPPRSRVLRTMLNARAAAARAFPNLDADLVDYVMSILENDPAVCKGDLEEIVVPLVSDGDEAGAAQARRAIRARCCAGGICRVESAITRGVCRGSSNSGAICIQQGTRNQQRRVSLACCMPPCRSVVARASRRRSRSPTGSQSGSRSRRRWLRQARKSKRRRRRI